jgi:GNAT superfamily N-acetyltransferase
MDWTRGEYTVSTDRGRLDIPLIQKFLAEESYWAPAIPLPVVRKSIEGSLCFGIYRGREQVGFARVVTDYATFGWVADVFVVKAHRGRGLGKLVVQCVTAHPKLQGFRRWMLGTEDAHGLYEKFGFRRLEHPGRMMERANRDIYRRM